MGNKQIIKTNPAAAANQRLMKQRSFRRLTMSAKTPAGGVKRKNGRDATVDIREGKKFDEPSMFIVQVAAGSCPARHVPQSETANHSFRYSRFRMTAKL